MDNRRRALLPSRRPKIFFAMIQVKKERVTRGGSCLKNPLSILLQLFSLSTNAHREKNFNSCFSLLKIIVTGVSFGILQVFSIYYKVIHVYSGLSVSVRLTDSVQTIYDYCQYTVDLFFVYKYGRHLYQEYYKQYDKIDQIIGTGSCSAIRKKITKLVILFVSIWLICSVMDFSAWVVIYGWTVPIVFSVSYNYLLLKILTNLDLTYQTMHIEVRLQVISGLMQSYYTSCDPLPGDPGVKCDLVQNKNWFYSNFSVPLKDSLKWSSESRQHGMRWLSRCYLLLKEQNAFVNKMFGVRILLNSLSLLIDMVRFANLAIRLVMGSQSQHHVSETKHLMHHWEYFTAVSTTCRLIVCAVILTNLVHHCELVYRQTDRIICISDHLLLNKNPDPELRAAVTELRELVQTRPIDFHMANFIRLDYSMLMSTASVVVTYTIILLQSLN